MSEYKNFTCIAASHYGAATPANRALWEAVRNNRWLEEMATRINAGEESLKAKLPIWTPRCCKFKNNHRAETDALEITNTFVFDIDEKGRTEEIMAMMKDGKIGDFEVLLIEESIRHGTHVAVILPDGLSPNEAQELFSASIGMKVDPAVKNVAGCIYQVPASHTRYVSERLFGTPSLPPRGEEKEKNVEEDHDNQETQGLAPSTQGLHPALGSVTPTELFSAESTTKTSIGCEPYVESTTINSSIHSPSPARRRGLGEEAAMLGAPCGLDWSSIVNKYIEMFWDGIPPMQGNRNSLTFEIAVHLRTICDYRQDVLEAIIPRWAGFPEDEWRQTIKNANNEPKKGIPARIKQVIQALKPLPIAANRSKEEIKGDSKITVSLPPEPPKRLPSFIKLISSKAPKIAKTAVMANIWPAVGVNMNQVKFKYIDNTYHEPTFMCQLIGVQSIGKGYIVVPIESMLRNIRASDKINREREAEYKRKNPVGAKKERDVRPNFVVQCLTENCTDAAFTQRLIDAQNNGEKYLYIRVDEVEQLRKLTSDKRIDSFHLIVRNSFDNHIHGQDRVGADSISGEACLRFNFNASSTPSNAVKFWKKGANDGTLSRLLVSAIIKDETDEELDLDIPIQGEYDDAYYAELQPYLNRLNAANGLIECPQALRLAKTMALENLEKAKLYESGAYKSLCFRANVLAYLKAMCLYVMEGYRWTKDIENFVRWSYEYDMWCKMHFFGSIIENEILAEKNLEIGDPKDIFHLLEKEFTYQEYMEMRVKEGKKGDGKSLLCMWKKRKKVYYDQDRQVYVKL